MTYTMIFVLAPRLRHFLLLLKPEDHKNPIFRGNWTVPGGKVEDRELAVTGAIRELWEETGLRAKIIDMRPVCRFYCNCDPTEPEHEVIVYATVMRLDKMRGAVGDELEPVKVHKELPVNIVPQLRALLELVILRLKQPV
jgi:8-oxo-dGTP pyrophosphatase MutT (NUDIX family)